MVQNNLSLPNEEIIYRGDIYLGKEGAKFWQHPVVVLQNQTLNNLLNTVVVLPLSNLIPRKILATQFILTPKETGLTTVQLLDLAKIVSIPKADLDQRVGTLSPEILKQINTGLSFLTGVAEESEFERQIEQTFRYLYLKEVPYFEDLDHEFKDVTRQTPKNAIRNLSSYATAFLNSRGGSIYYGIDDDGRVTGFKAQRSELDELKKDMYSILETIEPKISGDNYLIRFHEVYLNEEELFPDMYVLEVVVPNRSRLNEVFFDHGSDVYLKLDGIRKKLKGSEIVDFILRKKMP